MNVETAAIGPGPNIAADAAMGAVAGAAAGGATSELCSHCLLPAGLRATTQTLNGESRSFCCYGCSIAYQVKQGRGEESEAAWLLIRLGVGSFLSMNIMLFSLVTYAGAFTGVDAGMLPIVHWLLWILATPAVAILGGPFLRETVVHALHGRLTSSALIVVGAGAAYVYSAVAVIEGAPHVYFDTASMVLMLFTVGRYLEAAGRAKAARDLEPLLEAERGTATVVAGGFEAARPVREVAPGMLVRVRPGERIPIDGEVVDGEAHADEAVLTGESRQVMKSAGSPVFAGSIDLDGPLLIRVTAPAAESRWAQICRSVRDALVRRSPIQRLAERLVGLSVPLVLLLGAVAAFYWSRHVPFDRALLVGLAVLVVACPCAVGLAAPMATSLGIGRLARRGCVVRDPAALEMLARATVVAFDKTGTLTAGRPRLAAIVGDGAGESEILARAAGLERHAEHGLARAIVQAADERGIAPVAAGEVRILAGRGLHGRAGTEAVAAGSAALMRELAWPMSPALTERLRLLQADGHSVVLFGWDGRVRAVLAFDDLPLPEARGTVGALQTRGFRAAMLTGDLAPAAARVAQAAGIDDVQATLTPERKCTAIAALREDGAVVAMVGDGINDAPVLAAADVSIAVGTATDLARETAALVLPPGGLWLLPWIVDIARGVRMIILTNLFWAFGYNLIALTMAAFGLLQPVLAASVMAGSSVLVVLNSLRLERLPDPDPERLTASAPAIWTDTLPAPLAALLGGTVRG